MAIDGDPATRWATDAGTSAAWLEVDLGKEMTFDHVNISEATEGMAPRVESFQIQIKDGAEWKSLMEGKGIGAGYVSPRFAPATARIIRLNILKASEGPTIEEFSPGKAK